MALRMPDPGLAQDPPEYWKIGKHKVLFENIGKYWKIEGFPIVLMKNIGKKHNVFDGFGLGWA